MQLLLIRHDDDDNVRITQEFRCKPVVLAWTSLVTIIMNYDTFLKKERENRRSAPGRSFWASIPDHHQWLLGLNSLPNLPKWILKCNSIQYIKSNCLGLYLFLFLSISILWAPFRREIFSWRENSIALVWNEEMWGGRERNHNHNHNNVELGNKQTNRHRLTKTWNTTVTNGVKASQPPIPSAPSSLASLLWLNCGESCDKLITHNSTRPPAHPQPFARPKNKWPWIFQWCSIGWGAWASLRRRGSV